MFIKSNIIQTKGFRPFMFSGLQQLFSLCYMYVCRACGIQDCDLLLDVTFIFGVLFSYGLSALCLVLRYMYFRLVRMFRVSTVCFYFTCVLHSGWIIHRSTSYLQIYIRHAYNSWILKYHFPKLDHQYTSMFIIKQWSNFVFFIRIWGAVVVVWQLDL